ncbi:MAG: SPFH domain-containing protein [Prevotella sp.]|jgi:membrane protease subunit (stomatin/prohibitin family)|nr:SPFH domain-containing protein [Prevotella sp.]
MGLFGNKSEGGFMNVIRCDEQEYLVHKWRPSGEANSTKRENSIRYGSSLRVKDGELAVFVYKQNDGSMQDFIVGPYDQTIKTANFPVLASIVGLAFGGNSPFQAEIYFINLSGNIQVRFGIPYFDVFDPRFLDFAVPMAARGTITFNITDYKGFIKLNRLINFELEDFQKQIKDAVTKYVKGVITNIPADNGIPVLQMERKLLEINDIVTAHLKPRLENDFGVNLKGFDLATIDVDKESEGYAELRKNTAQQTSKTIEAQTDVNIRNLEDTQKINAANMEETLRVQREEAQRAQKLQTETNFIGAHALNQQTEVLKTGAENLGKMGTMNAGGGNDGGFNPAGMMTGMAMGGAMGGQMANMMNQMGQNMQQQQNMPPPPPQIQYNVSVNGQTTGPFNWQQLQQMAQNGQLTRNTYVWKQGMANWELAGAVQELNSLFGAVPPPPPPM